MEILTLDSLDVTGKRVLIRSDLNVPLDYRLNITDDTRIRASIPAIKQVLDGGGAAMVVAHLGRPKAGENQEEFSLAPVAKRLSELLGIDVPLVNSWVDGVDLELGELVLLENCRMIAGETENDDVLSKKMAELCDVYVNDAFGAAHRAHASTHGIARYANEACAGPLVMTEVAALSQALNAPASPFVAVVGGSKVSTKLTILMTLANKVDQLILGGGIANTFLLAKGYSVGASLAETSLVDEAKSVMAQIESRGGSIPLPTDVVCATELSEIAEPTIKRIEELNEEDMILDFGPASAREITKVIREAGTVVWNGPLGVFEISHFAEGTKALSEAVAKSRAFSIAGGGDTVAAVTKFGVTDKIDYISTAGGAFLEYLEGKTLPAIDILVKRARGSRGFR